MTKKNREQRQKADDGGEELTREGLRGTGGAQGFDSQPPRGRVGDTVFLAIDNDQKEPFMAQIVRVFENGRVNVVFWDEKGCMSAAHDLPFVQERRDADDCPFVVERSNTGFERRAQEESQPVVGNEPEASEPPRTEEPEPGREPNGPELTL
jgi:hypothetical protein